MRHQNITFSIPEDLKAVLLTYVDKRGMSRFISNAIREALEQENHQKEVELDAAYKAANQDRDRKKALKDWNLADDLSDLNNDEDWSWLKD